MNSNENNSIENKAEMNKWDSAIQKVEALHVARRFKEAYAVIEPLVKELDELDKSGKYQNTDDTIYTDMDTSFEVILLLSYARESRKELEAAHEMENAEVGLPDSLSVKGVDGIPISHIYALAGAVLIDLKRYEEAKAYLDKARRWRPTSFYILSEYAETFKYLGDMDGFLTATRDAHAMAFLPADVARCMRNLGYYFVEKGQWRKAHAMYRRSLEFDLHSINAENEMRYIKSCAPNAAQKLPESELKKLSQKYPIYNGGSPFVVGVAVNAGRSMMENGEYKSAVNYFTIAYGICHDTKIKKMLDEVKEKAAENA